MNIIESMDLLISLNNKLKKVENSKLLEKQNKLRYYLLIEIENSPEKSFILKLYLEEKIANLRKEQKESVFLIKMHRKVENIYIESLKELTLNQKRQFFDKSKKIILEQKTEKENKKEKLKTKIQAYA